MNSKDKTRIQKEDKMSYRQKNTGNPGGTDISKDPKAYSMESTMDRGNVNFKAHIAQHEGSMMAVATKDVVCANPTTPIIDIIKKMSKMHFKHMPIVNAGTSKLEGIITSVDIMDLLGGGERSLFLEKKFKGNLLSAINAQVRYIMEHDVHSLRNDAHIKKAFELMIDKHIGCIPVVDNDGHLEAICTERDFLTFIRGMLTGKKVEKWQTRNVKTADAANSIWDVARTMVENKFKRVPIVRDDILVGVVTSSDILSYLGTGEAFEKLTTGNVHEAFDSPISSLLHKELIWTIPDADLGEAAEIMLEKSIGCLPVIKDGNLEGILTERDILLALADKQ